MRPLVLGAGPAGCVAAIVLASGGARPILLDRDLEVGDALCGGFLSWRTATRLQDLGVDPARLGAHRVTRLRLFAGNHQAEIALPAPAYGLSRRSLDAALRREAIARGAELEIETARAVDDGAVVGQRRRWTGDGLFLATGKHDVRGQPRPRQSRDPALGLRLRLPSTSARHELLGSAIELHLFSGGYAGIVLQEDGTTNMCLAVRKSRLAQAGGRPHQLLAELAARHSPLARRLGSDWQSACPDTIGAVPYGFIARRTEPGLFRLGDQAAVIPSLAGEGIAIALASGESAARHWLAGGAASAPAYQRRFARQAALPVQVASLSWQLAENSLAARLGVSLAGRLPQLVGALMQATRLPAPPSLAPVRAAP